MSTMFDLGEYTTGSLIILLSALFLSASSASCDLLSGTSCPVEADRDPFQDSQLVDARGTIKYNEDIRKEWIVELDYNELLFVLTGDLNRQGDNLPPDNLPDRFREKGLRVTFSGTIYNPPSGPWRIQPVIISNIEKCD